MMQHFCYQTQLSVACVDSHPLVSEVKGIPLVLVGKTSQQMIHGIVL